MEANICDINHLDADVLLPPRKRLLAGFKKQTSSVNGSSDQIAVASSSSSPPSPSPSPSTSSSDVNAHLNHLLSSHLNNPNLSPEEIFEASRAAVVAAAKAAEAARAAADEKAAIAARAVVAAKSALELVATFSEDTVSVSKDRYLKKNKLKKHVPVQLLYKKHQPIENHRTDEELARRLHRAINSSPRILKSSPTSEWRGHKNKRPKSLITHEKTKVSNGGMVLGGSPSFTCNGDTIVGEIDSEDSIQESVKAEAKGAKYEKSGLSELDNGEAESGCSKERSSEDVYSPGKKRGRVKLKKLPLSICSFRDRVNPKEEMITKSSPLTEKNLGNPAAAVVKPLFSMEPSADGVISIEGTPVWKCQNFKAPACIKQNKVMQS